MFDLTQRLSVLPSNHPIHARIAADTSFSELVSLVVELHDLDPDCVDRLIKTAKRDCERKAVRDVATSKAAAVRHSLLQSLTVEVRSLVELDRFTALEFVLESAGYLNNGAGNSSSELGAAILGLASTLPLFWLRSVAMQAAFERTMLRPNRDEEEPDEDEETRQRRYERASEAYRDVMRCARRNVRTASERAA